MIGSTDSEDSNTRRESESSRTFERDLRGEQSLEETKGRAKARRQGQTVCWSNSKQSQGRRLMLDAIEK